MTGVDCAKITFDKSSKNFFIKINQEHNLKQFWLEEVQKKYISGTLNYNIIKDDKWLMLELMHKIQKKYGWKIFKELFKNCVLIIKENKYPEWGENYKKTDFFIENLSIAAGVNFYNIFYKLGFPVTKTIYDKLKHLPDGRVF
jgi:hypothetical protein